jgi:DNA-binding LytR/AlgR family response regulator
MTRFRVLVADDEPLARSMMTTLLQDDAEVESVIECGDATAVRETISRLHPDIVFLDIEMPEMTGLEIADDLTEDGPVIVFTTAFSNYVRIHSKRGRHMVRAPLASLEERLDPRDFMRVHRAAIVNVDEVREVHDKGALSVVLSDGTEVAVSRSRKSLVESTLLPRFRQR